MIVIIALFGIILILGLLIFLGKYIYYYFNPNETVENIIANVALSQEISLAGNSGQSGHDGVLNTLANNGLHGKTGDKGEIGTSGRKYMAAGSRGVTGATGNVGLHGINGESGIKGNPSNSLIPYVCYSQDNNNNLAPLVFEHDFSYNDVIHKLTASFIFEDVTYFSFKNGPTNTRYKIDTSGSDYYDVPASDPIGKARRIYSNIRIILERKEEGNKSDSIIFYTSSPINRSGYLIVSNNILTKSSVGVNRIEEIIIDINREFGLDFSTIRSSDLSYNYLLNGLAYYRVVFNIDPPLTDVKVRLEERFSPNPLSYFAIPVLKTESKNNLIKLKSDEDIFLLSPPFETGKVVLKDSSNPTSLWTMQNYTNLSDSITNINPQLIEAFDFLENDTLTFNDNLNKAKTILVTKQFNKLDIIQNLLIRLKSSDPKTLPNPNTTIVPPVGYKAFSTKLLINNLNITYPNTDSPLTYPSDLKGSNLTLFFVLRINIKDIEKVKYIVYIHNNGDSVFDESEFSEVSETNSFVISAIDTSDNYPYLPHIHEPGYLYYQVRLENQSLLDFESFFGRRMILKLSSASLEFESRVGSPAEYGDSETTRFSNHPPSENSFETSSSTYDFLNSGNSLWGFNVKFSATKFDIVEDSFLVGFHSDMIAIKFQKIIGFRQSNGDYILDVPLNGY